MDLTTTWLGLELPHPFMPGASPMGGDLDMVRRLEDAGAAAIVMHSLFEEQIAREEMMDYLEVERHANAHAEALSYFPGPVAFHLGPDEYLEQILRLKAAVKVPVIASLNGTTDGGWLSYARLMEEAGADALELNVYALATDPDESGAAIEKRTVDMLRAVRREVKLPVAIKLSPYYTSLAHFAWTLDSAGADGLLLFNRFLQPDIDIDQLEVNPTLRLSDPSELLLRLRWLAILSRFTRASLGVTGGVHEVADAVKAILAGAQVVQVVSTLLRQGPERLRELRTGLAVWFEEHGYTSLRQAQGSMNLLSCPDPRAYERANYMRVLQSWRTG